LPNGELIQEFKRKNFELLQEAEIYFRPHEFTLRQKSVPLSSRWLVSNGLNPGNVRHVLYSKEKKSPRYKPLALGRDMQRYFLFWSGT
jgi:adenine-specific DNA-methyltransferase